MALNTRKFPYLFSVGTQLAYKKYYGDVHYDWCTTEFNSKNQPPTSNPATICKRLLEQISTGDRHTHEIAANQDGILRGANEHMNRGTITLASRDEIRDIVAVAGYEAFMPVIYIVNSNKVKNRCVEVDRSKRASDNAVEYKIEDLRGDEYIVIPLKDCLVGVIEIADKKAGE